MSDNDLTIVAVGIFQFAYGIFLGWLWWGRCRHDWAEHWWIGGHYWECSECRKRQYA